MHAKPAFINRVTPQHQNFYVNAIDFYLRANKHLNFGTKHAQDSFKQAQAIEKAISKKYYDSPLRYEQVGDRVIEVLQRILRYRFITLRIKNLRYDLDNILQIRKASEQDLKRFEMAIHTSQKLKHKANKQQQNQPAELLAKRARPGAKADGKSKDEIELKTSSLVPNNFKTFHIFNGSLKLNGEDNVVQNFKNVSRIANFLIP